jgi:ABC-type lipoprotein export system ATPase subunit
MKVANQGLKSLATVVRHAGRQGRKAGAHGVGGETAEVESPMAQPILRAKNVHKAYAMGRSQVRVLRGASVSVDDGEFLVIMGSSGSGKSTLLHILGALDIPDSGAVEFRGTNLFAQSPAARGLYRNRDIGFVFQFYHLLPELSVLENVTIPRMVGRPLWKSASVAKAARRDATEMLARAGLSERLTHRPNELSGGERQRVAIARALINRPALLLADEPTGNLDEATGGGILKLLAEFNDSGQTIVMVTHDAKVAARAHRRVLLTEGAIRASGAAAGAKSDDPETARVGL